MDKPLRGYEALIAEAIGVTDPKTLADPSGPRRATTEGTMAASTAGAATTPNLFTERRMALTTESYIHHAKHGTVSFVGKDAVSFYAATILASALRLYAKTGIKVNSAYTPTNMRAAASRITGKTYGRSRDELRRAGEDVDAWAKTMRAALPETADPDSPSLGDNAAEPQKGGTR